MLIAQITDLHVVENDQLCEVSLWYVGHSPSTTYQGASLCHRQPYWLCRRQSKPRCSAQSGEHAMATSWRYTYYA